MKKLIVIVALLAFMTMRASAEIYPQAFVVGGIEDDALILVDGNENEWIWEGVEDYAIGDVVAAIMDDNNTTIIYDDMIMMIRYAGYMEGWE